MKCQVCGKEAGPEGGVCGYCGAKVHSLLGKGAPIAIPVEELLEGEEERRRRAERLRLRLRSHAIVGAVVFFALNVVIWIIRAILSVGMVAASGAYGRALPGLDASVWGMFQTLLVTAVTAVLIGAPAGYVISWRDAGPWGGAFLGAGIFAVGSTVLHLPGITAAARPFIALIIDFGFGGATGLIAGMLIGYHVRADDG